MISALREFLRQTGDMLRIVAIIAPAFLAILVYLHLNVEMAAVNRQLRQAALRKDELVKRNRALKSALFDLALQAGEDPLRWKSYESLPLLEKNKIVRIRLPESVLNETGASLEKQTPHAAATDSGSGR